MPNDLTPARLRALIAAARNDKTGWCECCSQVIGADAISLMAYMDEHAPALADALEAKELLEYLMGYVLTAKRRNTDEWMEGLVDALNSTEKTIGGNGYCKYFKSDGVIRVLRAAKEAAK